MSDSTQTTDFDSTIHLLQQDLSTVDPAIAIMLIERWENQLQGTETFKRLMELKQAILDGKLTNVETMLQELGTQTIAAAEKIRQEGAEEDVAANLEQMGELLSQASSQLS